MTIIRKQYAIGLLSNIYVGMKPLLFVKKLIPAVEYAAVIFSCDVGLMKPEMAMYSLAQERIGLTGSEILLIDDREDFLLPARYLGWQTHFFDKKHPKKSVDKLRRKLKR